MSELVTDATSCNRFVSPHTLPIVHIILLWLAACRTVCSGYFAERYCAAFGPPGSLQPGQPAVGGWIVEGGLDVSIAHLTRLI